MDRISSFMKNRKLVVVSLISLLAFLVCVVGNLYACKVVKHTNMYYYNAEIVSPNMKESGTVEQEVILRNGDEGIAVKFATYMTQITSGTVEAEVCNEKGDVLATFSVPASEIMDNQFCEFVFEDVAQELWNQKCLLRLRFVGIGDQTIAIYLSDTDTENNNCVINDEQQSFDLVVRGLKQSNGLGYRDIRLFYVFALVLVMSYVIYKTKFEDIRCKLQQTVDLAKTNKKTIVLTSIIVVGCAILAYFGEIIWSLQSQYKNPYRCIMLFVIFSIIALTVMYRKYIWKYAHVYFFGLIMSVGTLMIISVPPVNISWDEQIHYEDAAYMSWGATGKISEADNLLVELSTTTFEDEPFLKRHALERIELLNAKSNTDLVEIQNTLSVRSVSYIPASVGLYMGRLLNLDFHHTYMLGKIASLFTYAFCIALSIKILQGRGKMIAATIGLIPTSIFMAISYAYDWWVVALVILGFSIFIGEIQKNGRIGMGKMYQSVGIMSLGILTKAVYFPLLFPLMLMKKEHYEESKKSRVLVVLGMVALLATFILPMLFFGAGEGDTRGGSDVNSTEQIKFVLSNVFGYAEILLNFLWTYFSPDKVSEYLTYMAYIGYIEYANVCVIALTIAAIADNSEHAFFRKETPWLRWGNCLGVLGAIVLVASALYVSFTPVGLETINGCQYRYLLPVIFPFLFFMGENNIKISENQKRDVYVFVSLAMVFVVMNGWYNVVISTY